MDRSTPGFPIFHCLPEFAQIGWPKTLSFSVTSYGKTRVNFLANIMSFFLSRKAARGKSGTSYQLLSARWMVGGGRQGVRTKAGCLWEADRAGWGLWSLREVVGMINGSSPCPYAWPDSEGSGSVGLSRSLESTLALASFDSPGLGADSVCHTCLGTCLLRGPAWACMMGVVGTPLGADPHEL